MFLSSVWICFELMMGFSAVAHMAIYSFQPAQEQGLAPFMWSGPNADVQYPRTKLGALHERRIYSVSSEGIGWLNHSNAVYFSTKDS